MRTTSPVSRRAALLVACMLTFVRIAAADDIRVMTSGTFTAAYLELRPQLERSLKVNIVTTATSMGVGTDSIPSRLERGEAVDVVIVADDALNELIKNGRVLADSRVELARSGIGMAVRKGAPKPDISSLDALTRTLLQAKSIAYSASVSGRYLTTELFQRLGIADQVLGKSRRIDRERVGAVVARGEAEIGFQQISELLPEPGIDYVGPLPPEVQRVTVFSAGVSASSKNAAAARALIRFLASSEAASTVKEWVGAHGAHGSTTAGTRAPVGRKGSHRQGAGRRRRTRRCSRRGRDGHGSPRHRVPGSLRRGRCRQRPSDDRRYDLPHRVDDQTGHLAGGDAAGRTGPAQPRRSGREVPSAAGEPESLRDVRRQDRRVHAAARQNERRPSGTCSRTRLDSATTSRARSCATSSRARAKRLPRVRCSSILASNGSTAPASIGAGRIVETLSGKNLEVYFRDHIFGPLGMVDTSYNQPDDRRRRLAVVHRRRPDGTFQVDPVQPPMSVAQSIGGGGLASTAPDYIRFLQMLLNQGTLNGARIVSPETVATMGRNHIGSVGVRAVKTAMPERSSDFTFVADGRDKWGIGFMITADGKPGGRSAGSLSWGGHQQHVLLGRSGARYRRRDSDAVPSVCRQQGARGVRRVRAGGV